MHNGSQIARFSTWICWSIVFRLRHVWDIHHDAQDCFFEAPNVFELTPAVQFDSRRLQLVHGVEAADEAGVERFPVGDASRSVLQLPPGDRFTREVSARSAARLIGLAARHIGVHVRAPRRDHARFSEKQRRILRRSRALLSRQQLSCPR